LPTPKNPRASRVEAVVQSAWMRRLTVLSIEQLAIAVALIFGGGILMLLLGTQILEWYWLVLLAFVGLGIGAGRVRSRVFGRYHVAQLLDRELGLHDSLSSAWFLRSRAGADPEPAASFQLEYAERLAATVYPASALPFTRSRRYYFKSNFTRSVQDDLASLVREKGHRFSVTGGQQIPLVMVDPQLLRQVVMNLTSNAIKYTPTGGEISIRIGTDSPGMVRWAITDTGIGIPKGSLAKLFEKFYRAENVHTVETEGTGLGLYLVRLIVERFAGQVWCEAEEGRGSTFIFTLPIEG